MKMRRHGVPPLQAGAADAQLVADAHRLAVAEVDLDELRAARSSRRNLCGINMLRRFTPGALRPWTA